MEFVLSCTCVFVCVVCMRGVIGRKWNAIDKLWRKKPSAPSKDLKLEAQSKTRIKQHSVVQPTPHERVPSGQHTLLLETPTKKRTIRISEDMSHPEGLCRTSLVS